MWQSRKVFVSIANSVKTWHLYFVKTEQGKPFFWDFLLATVYALLILVLLVDDMCHHCSLDSQIYVIKICVIHVFANILIFTFTLKDCLDEQFIIGKVQLPYMKNQKENMTQIRLRLLAPKNIIISNAYIPMTPSSTWHLCHCKSIASAAYLPYIPSVQLCQLAFVRQSVSTTCRNLKCSPSTSAVLLWNTGDICPPFVELCVVNWEITSTDQAGGR